jgi:hypothetical protein
MGEENIMDFFKKQGAELYKSNSHKNMGTSSLKSDANWRTETVRHSLLEATGEQNRKRTII